MTTLAGAPVRELDRTLATLERISALTPIENADAIESATVRGWNVVVKKGEFAVGDPVIYFEINSLLPLDDQRFAFLAPRGEKTVNGIRGHVLKTARLRGTYSQGLVLPVALFPEVNECLDGITFAERLGISKYEEPVPAEMEGKAAGPFPRDFAPKTTIERAQNLTAAWDRIRNLPFIATEKIDGTSTTFINDGGRLRVAGRNWEYTEPASPAEGSVPWKIAAEYGILEKLPEGWAVQGEIYGAGVTAKNRLKINGKRFAAFNVLDHGVPVPRSAWPFGIGLMAAPVLKLRLPATVAEAVEQVNGLESVITPGVQAEGVVWHHANGTAVQELGGRTAFKVINNKWLLKNS
ncbi:RNA ligase (ATP) [Arthrobacter caoxuetaonis]|uniref:RNA ligase (ATP) n=1 Tax=Arthrobacter caoxuetaonis TaxID=2886935 RepID=A0A9X1SE18_9MICC|nr:RNA ligase (ATP) [Arthrobacter caoxuetaonis]MCC3299412.1 RNA ligase (ATP) [Arthrobacter caoxuetaonis]USQ59095.1 RNA ligase (ATP) [Arthrobacter caoxuetaonis]